MKKVKFSFNIYTPSDVWKWIWDIFCFPRREIVKRWIVEYHDDLLIESIIDAINEKLDSTHPDDMTKSISDLELKVRDIFAKQEQNTIQIIMKYKNI